MVKETASGARIKILGIDGTHSVTVPATCKVIRVVVVV